MTLVEPRPEIATRAEPVPPDPRRWRRHRAARSARARRLSTRGPATPRDGSLAVLSLALVMAALLCLWSVLQMLFLGSLSHERAQEELYREFRAQLASATAPVGPVVPVGDPVALLRVPRLGLEEVVVEGTASGDTLVGPGHRRDTVLPGQVGTAVVYGRAATYGGPFRDITELVAGDRIDAIIGQGQISFRVLGVRRAGDPLPVPAEEGVARLTLVTAEGTGRLASISPGSVVYVDAQAEKGFAAPPGLPGGLPETEKAMASDPAAVPLVALWLSGLLGLTLAIVAALQRWSPVLVWVVASPLALALAWLTTDGVMRLLPNLI